MKFKDTNRDHKTNEQEQQKADSIVKKEHKHEQKGICTPMQKLIQCCPSIINFESNSLNHIYILHWRLYITDHEQL